MGYTTRRQQAPAPSAQVEPSPPEADLQSYGNAAVAEEVEAMGRRLGPQSKEEALAARRYDLRAVADLLDRGRRMSPEDPQEKLLKNSIEWIDAGLCKLVVLSPTHDGHRRKLAPGEVAYFDTRVVFPNEGADYETGSDEGITVEPKSLRGMFDSDSNTMFLYAPGHQDPAEVATTLIHEIQHDADDSGDKERWSVSPEEDLKAHDDAEPWAWNHYQSEFRAYWIDQEKLPEARTELEVVAVDEVTGKRDVASTNFANRRQAAIFSHLWHRAADGVYWDPKARAWTRSNGYLPYYYVFDPNFRKMVDDLETPVGGNLLNSPRIELLSLAIEGLDWAAIEAAAAALDSDDKSFLADHARSETFWRWVTRLNPEERLRLQELIGISAP